MQNLVVANTLNGTLSATFGLPSLQMAIDAGVSQLWLPKVVCDKLSDALGLIYDSSTELYLVNDTAHKNLVDLAPEFTFTLAANATSSETVNTILPYAAFDLQVGQPFYNTTRHYFPIRRAADEKLYVLGRTFLQEAYLIVDWERGNFSIGQARHQSTEQSIVPIHSDRTEPSKRPGISSGAIAGIVVGAIVAMLVAAASCYAVWRKKRSQAAHVEERASSPYPDDKKDSGAIELSGVGPSMVEANSTPVHELHQDTTHQQLMSTPIYELPGDRVEGELDACAKAERLGPKQ